MYVEQCNAYHEVSVLCANIYTLTTLDAEQSEYQGHDGKATSVRSVQSGCISLVPRVVSHLYNCQGELQPCNYISFHCSPKLSPSPQNLYIRATIHRCCFFFFFFSVSVRDSEVTDVDACVQLVATPSLIATACVLLNNLIFIGQHEVVAQIYEHSIDKYLFGYVHAYVFIISHTIVINVTHTRQR